MTPREKKDSIIAAAVTMTVALILLLILFFTQMGYDRALLAQASTPEPMMPENVEFLEPELDLSSPGSEDANDISDDAPLPEGEPDPEAPADNNRRVEPGPVPEPRPVKEPVATQKKPSPVKTSENSMTEEERKRLPGSNFNKSPNGSPNGKNSAVNGQGSVNANGSLSGRTFKGCTTGPVEVSSKVTVTVGVTVKADGSVAYAKARRGPKAYYAVCEKWALTAKWSAKEGAPVATGTITFTITPR